MLFWFSLSFVVIIILLTMRRRCMLQWRKPMGLYAGWWGVLLDRGPLSWTVCLKRAYSIQQNWVCCLLPLSGCGSLSGLKGALTSSRRLVLHHKTPCTLINRLAPQHCESIGISQSILGLSYKEAISKLGNTDGARQTEKAARHSQNTETSQQGQAERQARQTDCSYAAQKLAVSLCDSVLYFIAERRLYICGCLFLFILQMPMLWLVCDRLQK